MAPGCDAPCHQWTEMAAYDHNQGFEGKRGKKESAVGYAAFVTYCELGRSRSTKKVAQIVGTSHVNISNFSKRYNWSERAAAWDADQVKKSFAEVRKERETRHRQQIKRFRDEQEQRAQSMGELADLMMDLTREKIQAMQAAGQLPSEQQISNLAKTVASLADMAMNLKATALGVDELMDVLEDKLDS